MNTQLTSSVDHVRSNPGMYVGSAGPNLYDLMGAMAADAVCLGAPSVSIVRFDAWFIVESEFDWVLAESRFDLVECFNRIQIFHKHRQNSCRMEIVLNAFAQDVVVMGQEGFTIIKNKGGEITKIEVGLKERYKNGRAVACRGLDPPAS